MWVAIPVTNSETVVTHVLQWRAVMFDVEIQKKWGYGD